MAANQPIAFVTGTSSGFGLLISITLAQHGYHVIATMRNTMKQKALMDAAAEHNVSQRIECHALDVTDHQAIHTTVKEVIDRYGRIDVLVNNAGVSLGGFIEEIPLEDWRQAMETNFFALVAVTQEVLPHMRAAKAGKIINMGSVSGRIGFPGYGPYAASKFALEGFSESLRLEMLPYRVYVSLIEPGAYKTAIWSKGLDYLSQKTNKESPYQEHLEAILAYTQNVAEKASDPQAVANTVLRIAQDRRPNLRYVLGRGTLMAVAGKALLPWKWFERIIWRTLKNK